jgi:hypothetical protein
MKGAAVGGGFGEWALVSGVVVVIRGSQSRVAEEIDKEVAPIFLAVRSGQV